MNRNTARIIFISAVILVGGGLISKYLASTKPKPKMKPREVIVIPVVVMKAEPRSLPVIISAMGTVIPARELQLKSEVSGRITKISPNMVPGGIVKEGELLVRIYQRDYDIAARQARAQLAEAKSRLKLEEGRQVIARREWELLNEDMDYADADNELVLRKPQLANAKAGVSAARSALSQTYLNINRTRIKAPFNAIVKTEIVEKGLVINPQILLATLIGSDVYWVQVSIPMSQLQWVQFPDGDGKGGSEAIVTQSAGGRVIVERKGRVIRLLGDLERAGRLARVIVEIEDPMGLGPKGLGPNGSPLLIDAFVRVRIEGPMMENLYALPRRALHEGDRVWVMGEDDKLEIREVKIAFVTEDEIFIQGGINPGERVITSAIATPLPGTMLKESKQ